MISSSTNRILKLFTITFALLFVANSQLAAQASEDFFHSIGKIYVVVAVIVITFIGIGAYLFYLDRKITELEKKIK